MTESPGIGVVTLDTGLRIRSWSVWLADCSGVPEEAAIGRPFADFTPPRRTAVIVDHLTEVLSTGATRVLAPAFHHYLVACPPPRPNPHFAEMQQHVTLAPLRDTNRIVGVIVTIEDVTGRLIDEREIVQRAARGGLAPDVLVARAGADDWRVRATATRALRQTTTEHDIAQLLEALERDHHDFNVLSGALQVLAASERDITAPLVGLLTNPSANLRAHAALALGAMGDPAAVPPLVQALDDDDGNVRFHAIEALGRLAAPDAVEGLQRIALSGDFFLAFPAIDALAQIDDAAVLPALMELLEVENLRPAVIDAIGALGDEDCVGALVGLLNDGRGDVPAVAGALVNIARRYEATFGAGASISDAVRHSLSPAGLARLMTAADAAAGGAAYVVLGWAGEPALEALVAAFGADNVCSEAVEAIRAIGAAAIPVLTHQLAHGSSAAGVCAARLLGDIGDPRAIPALIAALSSHDSELVIAAARALTALSDRSALDGLLALFAHPHVGVRQAAVAAVNSLDADLSRSPLSAMLTAADAHVRECAVRSLGYFSPDSSAAGLLNALTDDIDEVRRAAIEQLPFINDPRSIPALLDALTDEVPANRAAAAHALRLCDDARGDAVLIDALGDDHPWVRYFTAETLGHRRTRAAAETLEAMARADGAPHVRIAALRALSQIDATALMRVVPSAVDDDDPEVVAAAVAVLAVASGPEPETLLERALQSPLAAVRLAAAEALGHLPTLAAIQMLAWAARLPDPPALSGTAMSSLRQIAASGGGHAAVAVRALLQLGADRARRDDVVNLMGTLEPESVAPLCGSAVREPALRAVAIDALARMRRPEATQLVAAALADPDAAVRRTAVDAFGRLGSATVADTISTMAVMDADPTVRRRAAAVSRRYGWHAPRLEDRP